MVTRARWDQNPRSHGVKRAGLVLGIFIIFLAETVALQWIGAAYANGFGSHPDEAAHFVSALMVRDFLAGGHYLHPLAFARDYYLHYPKVAIGHWPPMLYGLLGIWMLVFGASRAAALAFIAIAAAAIATVIQRLGSRLIGGWAGWFAGLTFLALPLTQESSARVMTEQWVTLLTLASAVQVARFMRTERTRDGIMFGVIAAAAILTRGSAWSLVVVPGIALVLSRRYSLLSRPGLWVSAIPILVLCVPWYLLSRGMGEGAWVGYTQGTPYVVRAMIAYPTMIGSSLGWSLLLPAGLGLWSAVVRPWRSRQVGPEWASLAALAVATIALHSVVPTGIEPRFMLTVMPTLLLLAAAGVDSLGGWMPIRIARPALCGGLFLLVALAFLAERFELPTRTRNQGYEALARDLTRRFPNVPETYLIAADSRGEGSMIAAMALAERRPGSFILRGSKILVHEDWLGRGTQDRFGTVKEVSRVLSRIPVDVVVIDDAMQSDQRRAYHDRVERTVSADSTTWEHVGSYAVVSMGRVHERALQVYARRGGGTISAGSTPPDVKLIGELTQ